MIKTEKLHLNIKNDFFPRFKNKLKSKIKIEIKKGLKMGNLIISVFAAAAILGGYSYMKTKQDEMTDKIKVAKTVDTYVQRTKLAEKNNLHDPEYQTGLIAMTNNKNLLHKFQKALDIALKSKNNPTCEDLVQTGEITYKECKKIENMKNPLIAFYDGKILTRNVKDFDRLKQIIAYRLGKHNSKAIKKYMVSLRDSDVAVIDDVQIQRIIHKKARMIREYSSMKMGKGFMEMGDPMKMGKGVMKMEKGFMKMGGFMNMFKSVKPSVSTKTNLVTQENSKNDDSVRYRSPMNNDKYLERF
jgi:CHASE3 domain sensor protein